MSDDSDNHTVTTQRPCYHLQPQYTTLSHSLTSSTEKTTWKIQKIWENLQNLWTVWNIKWFHFTEIRILLMAGNQSGQEAERVWGMLGIGSSTTSAEVTWSMSRTLQIVWFVFKLLAMMEVVGKSWDIIWWIYHDYIQITIRLDLCFATRAGVLEWREEGIGLKIGNYLSCRYNQV